MIFSGLEQTALIHMLKCNLILSAHQEAKILKYTSVLPVVRSFLGGRLNAKKAKKVWQPLLFELFPYNYTVVHRLV